MQEFNMNENQLIASFRPTQPNNQVQNLQPLQSINNTSPPNNPIPPQQYLQLSNNTQPNTTQVVRQHLIHSQVPHPNESLTSAQKPLSPLRVNTQVVFNYGEVRSPQNRAVHSQSIVKQVGVPVRGLSTEYVQNQSVHQGILANNAQISSPNSFIQGGQNQVIQAGTIIYDPNLHSIQQPLPEHSNSQPQPAYAQKIYTNPAAQTQFVQVQNRGQPQVIKQGYVQYTGQVHHAQQQLVNPVYVQQTHQVTQQTNPNLIHPVQYIAVTPPQIKNQTQIFQDINSLPAEERQRLWHEQQLKIQEQQAIIQQAHLQQTHIQQAHLQQMQQAHIKQGQIQQGHIQQVPQGHIQQGQIEQGQIHYIYPPGAPPEGYEYPPQYYEQHQQQAYAQYYDAHGQPTLWQERFFYLYQKFETFYQKYEGLNKEGAYLADQFLTVDSEEEWLGLKEKYDSLVERMGQVKEQNSHVLQEMQQNIQQNQKIENSASIKQEAGRVWEHRYHELLEQYESLTHHYAQLQSSSMAHNDIDQNERISMMNQKYARLEAEYNHVIQQLQNSQNTLQVREEHEDLLKYTQQLQGYIEQLESQNNNLMRGMKTSVEGSKMLPESQLAQKLADKDSQIKNLSQMIVSLQQKVKIVEQRPKSNIGKDVHTSQLENQIHQMNLYCTEIEQKLSMKEYETNGLKDKLEYMEEQLHLKDQELNNHTKLLSEKLSKIENDIATKAAQHPPQPIPIQQPSYVNNFSLEEDYEARIKQYQRSIQTKNNQIKNLQDRISDSEAHSRKISMERSSLERQWQERYQNLQEQFRKKSQEKDYKIRALQQDLKDKELQMQKKISEKDVSMKVLESQMTRIKEQVDMRIVEKDTIIKGLRDTTQRVACELRDKNSEISRIKSPVITPHLRSPSQSYVGFGENIRYDEEIRLIADQLERKSDEIVKLKKERDSRNKQYKDLQLQYQTLQEESNKRRIELNNLKRQGVALENMQLEAQNLRVTLNKRNQQISQLKNALYQKDRLKMELQNAKRELQKYSEISRLKNRQIQQLNDRNYELQEKIRQREFKNANKPEQNVQKHAIEETMQLNEDIRRKQIEISRLKAENEDLVHSLRRQSDELQNLKLRYPNKLKLTEEELTDAKLKLVTIEKKYVAIEGRAKELQEQSRKNKIAYEEEQSLELARIREHYTKLIEKLQDENKNVKEKMRAYEIKVHEQEVEIDALSSKKKQLQIFKDDYVKKLIYANERLQAKQEELKNNRQKESTEGLKFRKKETKTMELEAALKSRDEQARQSEKQKEILRGQLRALKKQFEDYKHQVLDQMEYSTHKEMENLNKQLDDYEAKFALQNYNFDFKTKDKRANQIFERTVIYQLKEENQFLRKELEGRGSNISLQKMKITQMQQETLLRSKRLSQADNQPAQQELQFYRQKNKELQERVNSHITVNKNLKQRIDQLVESNQRIEEIDRLVSAKIQLEKTVADYQQKINRLLEQNARIRQQRVNAVPVQNDTHIYQIKIHQASRTISQLTLERNTLADENQLLKQERNRLDAENQTTFKNCSKLQNKIVILTSEIQRLKEISSQVQKVGSNQNQLKIKIESLSREISQRQTIITQMKSKASQFQQAYHNLEMYVKQIEEKLQQAKQDLLLKGNNESEAYWKNAVSSLENSLHIMTQRMSQLENQVEFYKSQTHKGVPDESFYFLELMRSNYLQLESLASEISIQSENMAVLAERVNENCRRGLQSCQYLHELLSQ